MGGYQYISYWHSLHTRHRGALAAVGYNGLGEGFNRASYRLRRRAVLRLLARHPGLRRASLLEAAVGVGAYAPVWQRLGVSQWHGLDISNDAVAFCRERYPQGVFFVQDLTAQQWSGPGRPEKDYDVVTAIDVLYHLVEDADFEKALRHLEQRVRPGGVLLVSDVFVPHDQQTAPHVKRRSLSTYRRLLGPRMSLLDREPVFAVLGDTSARPGCLADAAKNLLWKATAQTVLHTPGMLRDAVGAAAVYLIWPLDAALRSLGAPAGTNLELALFQKR